MQRRARPGRPHPALHLALPVTGLQQRTQPAGGLAAPVGADANVSNDSDDEEESVKHVNIMRSAVSVLRSIACEDRVRWEWLVVEQDLCSLSLCSVSLLFAVVVMSVAV